MNVATNVSREAETNDTGEYIFLEVPVGTYEIDVQQAGFKKFARKDVTVHLNEVLNIDLPLVVGGGAEVFAHGLKAATRNAFCDPTGSEAPCGWKCAFAFDGRGRIQCP